MELRTNWEATSVKPLNSFPAFYGNRRFITAFTRVLHLFLSSARSIQYTPPHHIAQRSILILPTHLHSGLPSGLFPSGFPTNNLHAFLFFPIHATCSHSSHPPQLILNILGEEHKSRSSSVCSFLHPRIISSFFSPNILLGNLFSNTLSSC
jgi:hypothetical protein